METGFAVTAFLALFLNLFLPEEVDDEAIDITANNVDEAEDEKEWDRIRRPSAMRKSQEMGGRLSVDMEGGSVDKMPPVKEA